MTNSDSRLQQIQQLQFSDRAAAEQLLLAFCRETFPDLATVKVQLRPLAVSLNSFNGFLTLADGKQLFFKSHIEPNSIVSEYYNSSLLAQVGYPIIQPLRTSTEYGKQILIYDVIESPSVFDVARQLELGERDDLAALTAAQRDADQQLYEIYTQTLQPVTAEQHASTPVHQLFWHRLGARYDQFYRDQPFALPGITLPWESLLARRWVLNGHAVALRLGEMIDLARRVLDPQQPSLTVVGHGDAHNGNVFFTPPRLLYFDPAFGGRHSPMQDLTKPLFHNVAATWMYHPAEVDTVLTLQWHDDGETITVEHNYQPSAVRQMFLTSKLDLVLQPILPLLTDLHRQQIDSTLTPDACRQQMYQMLRLSLMCCPLLTMNLADRTRFSPQVGLLGLSYAVAMGGGAQHPNRSPFDQQLGTAFGW